MYFRQVSDQALTNTLTFFVRVGIVSSIYEALAWIILEVDPFLRHAMKQTIEQPAEFLSR